MRASSSITTAGPSKPTSDITRGFAIEVPHFVDFDSSENVRYIPQAIGFETPRQDGKLTALQHAMNSSPLGVNATVFKMLPLVHEDLLDHEERTGPKVLPQKAALLVPNKVW